MQKIAKIEIESASGFGGLTRVYKLSPKHGNYKYVAVTIQPAGPERRAEVHTFFTTKFGTPVGKTLRRETGSFTTSGDPFEDGEHHIEGCFAMALGLLGGYEIVSDSDA